MSRSNPTVENPNPAVRWMDWGGADGKLKYYNKVDKENVEIGDDFTFLLLDNLASIKGWHDPSGSGIYSNEVRDTRSDMFVVKSFKGGILCEGFYADIKDRVNSLGGKFTSNLYVAFKDGDELKIGVISFSGAALGAWMEFSKENRSDLYSSAVRIKGSVEGKKGKVVFKVPAFIMVKTTPATNEAATELDKKLRVYLTAYMSRAKTEQAKAPAHVADENQEHEYGDEDAPAAPVKEFDPESEIPF